MPRAATTSDTFNAIAEPRRRDILDYLAARERSVGEIVIALNLPQPSVSKHLGVLRDVGLVDVRRDGRQALYRTNRRGHPPAPRVGQPVPALLAGSARAHQAAGRARLAPARTTQEEP